MSAVSSYHRRYGCAGNPDTKDEPQYCKIGARTIIASGET
jgi:hypothetical protein